MSPPELAIRGWSHGSVSLIMAALAAGAQTANETFKDAHAGLKALVAARLRERPAGQVALERHETHPEPWSAPLEAELAEAGVDRDSAVVAAAQRVLAMVDPAGS